MIENYNKSLLTEVDKLDSFHILECPFFHFCEIGTLVLSLFRLFVTFLNALLLRDDAFKLYLGEVIWSIWKIVVHFLNSSTNKSSPSRPDYEEKPTYLAKKLCIYSLLVFAAVVFVKAAKKKKFIFNLFPAG